MKYLSAPFEVKSLKAREISGYASTFGNVDLGGDVVMPGAFAKSIKQHQLDGTTPKMLWNHDTKALPVGKWETLSEDGHGLVTKGVIADTTIGNDVRTLALMGVIDRMSIGYIPVDTSFDKQGNRLLHEIQLHEVSFVNFPMNPRATVEAAKAMFDPRSLEHRLRDHVSRAEAKEVVHLIYRRDKSQCEADESIETCDAEEMVLETANELATMLTLASIRMPHFSME